MGYLNRRGRPRIYDVGKDRGTKELQDKRKKGLTSEPIDICFHRGFISSEQHWAALHFRWLHTLRFGVTGVRAVDTTNIGGQDRKVDDSIWRKKRESEYIEALDQLRKLGLDDLVVEVCIHNECPYFLRFRSKKFLTIEDERSLRRLKRGLSQLVRIWRGNDPTILMSQQGGKRRRVA